MMEAEAGDRNKIMEKVVKFSKSPKNRKPKNRKYRQKMLAETETHSKNFLKFSKPSSKERKTLMQTEEKQDENVVFLERRSLREAKKQAVEELHNLHAFLGASRPADEQELELERLVFGGEAMDSDDGEDDEIEADETKMELVTNENERKAAWEDEDDKEILITEKAKTLKNCHRSFSLRGEEKYSSYTEEKFKKIMGAPKWAELDRENDDQGEDSDDELLKKTGDFIVKSQSLPEGIVSLRKCPSLSDNGLARSLIKSVEFHPTSKVALVGSTNGNVTLFQIDGKLNNKIQSVYFDAFPVHSAHFSVSGSEIIAGSNMFSHFYSYDMLAGKMSRIPWQKGMEQPNVRRFRMSPDGKYMVIHGRFGNIHLMTAHSKEWVGSLKMNGEVIAVTFNHDGSLMYSHGNTGEVYVWEMSSRSCIHKFTDEGCLSGTSITVSPNNQFLATGSDSGIVNVYEMSNLSSASHPQPVRVFKNLTTEITSMKFNATSELLAISSSYKADAVKLVHFPSMTVFSNFPIKQEHKIGHPNSLDISVNSGYLTIGNNNGTAHVYRLKYYSNY